MALYERFSGRSVAEVLEIQARERPDHPFIIYRDRTLTYGQLDARARALAAGLHHLGIRVGDRIALDLPNWPEFVISTFAAATLGATIVPLNPRFTHPELQFKLRHSEAAVAITVEELKGVDYLELFDGLIPTLPELQYLVTVGEEDLWYDDRIYQFEDLLSSGEGRELPEVEIDPDEDVFAILYTSGTMGKPKGVELTHTNLVGTAASTVDAIELSPEDVIFGVTTIFHVFGLGPGILGTTIAGASLVLQEQFLDRKSTRLNSSHVAISYAVFCLKKKKNRCQGPRHTL